MYDIAACIVTYRSDLEQLRRAVESFQAQPIRGHLTIVDNDSGADYLAELEKVGGVSLVSAGENRGYGAGHNIGLRRAPPHRYYLIMNPDVVIHDGALKAMIDCMDVQPEIVMCLPMVKNPDGTNQKLNKRLPSVLDFFLRRFVPKKLHALPPIRRRMAHYTMEDVGYEAPCNVPFPSGCFMLCRADALQKAEGFDERFFLYLEDCDLGRRMAEYGRIMYLPDAVITHHWTRGAHHSWRLMAVFIQSVWRYYQKWGWKWV